MQTHPSHANQKSYGATQKKLRKGLSESMLARNNLILTPLYDQSLSTDSELLEKQLGEFCCTKDPDIESYIRNKAISYECSGLSRTYLYLGGAGSDVELVAYLTLAITSVSYSDITRSKT